MSQILSQLNDEEIMGPAKYIALAEWRNARGEMGVYHSMRSPIIAESVLVMYLIDGQRVVDFHDYRLMDSIIRELALIARFADAERIV